MQKILIILSFIVGFASCQKRLPKTANFYYWKAKDVLDSNSINYLNEVGTKKIYLRCFDIHFIDNGRQTGAFPVSISEVNIQLLNKHFLVIPVVFIENQVFTKLVTNELDILAGQLHEKISKMFEGEITHLQIDCDWTTSTHEKYFAFLEHLINTKKLDVSTTIRLHQIKDKANCGVPPVKEGVLMLYNTGEVTRIEEENSILNPDIIESYLKASESYELKLTPALPKFSWGVLFRRENAIALLNNTDHKLYESEYFTKTDSGWFQCAKRCFIDGKWLYEGDVVRYETVKLKELKKSIEIFEKYLGEDYSELIFYHLNRNLVNDFPTSHIREIMNQ